MLDILFGSKNKERVLVFLEGREEGYARQIANYYNCELSPLQNQLSKLELSGVLVSKMLGRTRMYYFNKSCPYLTELKMLLKKAIVFLPEEEASRLLLNRRRPRRKGKPL